MAAKACFGPFCMINFNNINIRLRSDPDFTDLGGLHLVLVGPTSGAPEPAKTLKCILMLEKCILKPVFAPFPHFSYCLLCN